METLSKGTDVHAFTAIGARVGVWRFWGPGPERRPRAWSLRFPVPRTAGDRMRQHESLLGSRSSRDFRGARRGARRRLWSECRPASAGLGPRRPLFVLRLLLGLLAGLPSTAPAMRDAGFEEMLSWQGVGSFGVRGERPQALARASRRAWLAVGDASGVTWWRGDRSERADLPAVQDLAFDHEDVLWIGTEAGLYRWHEGGRPEPRSVGDGENADRIHRVVAVAGSLLLATQAGAYWSSDGRSFQALSVAGPSTPVTRAALRPAELGSGPVVQGEPEGARPRVRPAEAWLYGAGQLFVVRGVVYRTGLRILDARRVELPRILDDRAPMDLTLDPGGRRLFLVFEDRVLWRSLEPEEGSSTAAVWRVERPTMPPGARIQRLGWAAGRVWLATDRGLLEASTLAGPFRRAASPLGTSPCVDLKSLGPTGAVALCRSGLFALVPPAQREDPFGADEFPGSPGERDPLPPDPPVAEIRQRALARAGLAQARAEGLWQGLRRRAYWPDLSLGFKVDADRDWGHDLDQSFVSGDTRFLFDRSRDRALDLEGRIDLAWDLGGLVYPTRSVELSRELRQVVGLRDDVSDEIHQLYFERQSIRQRLKTGAPALEPGEEGRLRVRALELEAALDAWTGGWLSQWRLAHASPDE